MTWIIRGVRVVMFESHVCDVVVVVTETGADTGVSHRDHGPRHWRRPGADSGSVQHGEQRGRAGHHGRRQETSLIGWFIAAN